MEELFQAIFEFVFQAVLEIVVDALWEKSSRRTRLALEIVICVALGGLLGVVSSIVAPKSLVHALPLRIAYLVLAPILLGGVMSFIGRSRSRRGKRTGPLEKFGLGWLFAYSFALVRFFLTR